MCREISPAKNLRKKEHKLCDLIHENIHVSCEILLCCICCGIDDCLIGGDGWNVGLICQRYGATGGDSEVSDPPEIDLLRLPKGGDPPY